MGSLGDGLLALRALALQGHVVLSPSAPLGEKFLDELTYEAQKFFIFRSARMLDRELLSVHRMRSLQVMLRRLRAA